MQNKWAYYLGLFIIILGFITAFGQAYSGFMAGVQDGVTGEMSEASIWFEGESPLRLFILGTLLVGFHKVLNKDGESEEE